MTWGAAEASRMSARRSILILMALVSATLPAAAESPAEWWAGWTMDDPRLSQPRYTETVFEPISIVADDGVRLNARVLRPVTEPGARIPAILQLSPYLPTDIQPPNVVSELQKHGYVERGFALVAVSIRGFGDSGGCIDYSGARDRADADLILNTIAAQPWSNGKIGAYGLSYDGASQHAAAVTANPHLRAIVPVAGITDWFKWSYLRGIPAWHYGYTYNIYNGPLIWGLSNKTPSDRVAERACPTVPDSLVSQYRTDALGVRDPWWDERHLSRLSDRIRPDLAVLQVAGYRDFGVRLDNLDDWEAPLRARLPNYRVIVGDWAHLYPDTPDIQATYNPDFRFNPHPMTSWPILVLRWFDRYLNDRDTGSEQLPPALLQDQLGNWHAESAIEPARASTTRLYLAPQGRLDATAGAGEESFIDDGDNADPRGTCTYLASGIFVGCAPVSKPNVRFFATEAFDEEARFSGTVPVRLRLRHSMPRGQVGVTLYVVNAGGRWEALTYGFESFNLKDEYTFAPIEPGAPFDQVVELIARDVVIPVGSRLAIGVGAQVGVNPRAVTGNGYGPTPSGGQTTIELGQGSFIELNRLTGPTELLPIP